MFGTIPTVSTPLETSSTGQGAATVRFTGVEDIPISDLAEPLTWDDIQKRRAETNDGAHAWCGNLIDQVTDPEPALDDMTLGAEQLVGVGPLYCFWCHEPYPSDGTGPALAARRCPGKPAAADE